MIGGRSIRRGEARAILVRAACATAIALLGACGTRSRPLAMPASGASIDRPPATSQPSASPAPALDPVVAEFAGGSIRASELGRYLLQVDRASSLGALSKLVGERIVEREAASLGIAVPAMYLEEERRQVLDALQREATASYGIGTTASDFVRLEFRQDLETYLTMRLEEARRRWIVTRVVRYRALTTERAVLRILVVEDADLAQSVLDQLRAGLDFEALARRHSLHPSRELGGRLPPLAREALHPVVADRAFALAPGALTPVLAIEAPNGRPQYEIVRLEQRLAPLGGDYPALRETVEDSLRSEPLGREEWTAWMLYLERRHGVRITALSGPASRGYAPLSPPGPVGLAHGP